MKRLPALADRAAGTSPEAGQATSATSDLVRMYLREIGKVPLLTAAQEVDLAMRIEGGELAAELLASVERTDRLDRRRFQQVVEAVVRIRAHQLAPEKKLGREGIGRETVPRGYLPRSRTDATSFLRRVVDPPGHHPGHRRPVADDPHPRAHDRVHEQDRSGPAGAGPDPGAGPRSRRDRRGRPALPGTGP